MKYGSFKRYDDLFPSFRFVVYDTEGRKSLLQHAENERRQKTLIEVNMPKKKQQFKGEYIGHIQIDEHARHAYFL